MAYNSNPFLERMSERTTSDMEFVRLFSPKILEKLAEDAFDGAVHMFRSAPGAGKTTLLRAFTPPALRAFWNSPGAFELSEARQGSGCDNRESKNPRRQAPGVRQNNETRLRVRP